MSLEETAGSMDVVFGVWGAVGPSNHGLDGVTVHQGQRAILFGGGTSCPLNSIAYGA